MTNKSWDKEREQLRELLRELRTERAGMTQAELSKALGKPQSYVSKYETGERRLDYVEVYEICQAMELPVREFQERYEKKRKE